MKKLLKLRSWLTLDEAAESLSVLFGEAVSRAELLRLALDGEFTLSVRFLNAVYAKGGPLISSDNVRRIAIPGLKEGETIHIAAGIFIDDKRVIDIGREVKPITGLKQQLPDILMMIKPWGPLRSIVFKGGGSQNMDIYEVTFEHARAVWSIGPLDTVG